MMFKTLRKIVMIWRNGKAVNTQTKIVFVENENVLRFWGCS